MGIFKRWRLSLELNEIYGGKRLCFAKTVFFVIKSDFREYKNGLVLNSSQVVKTIENVFAKTSLENNNLLENKTS